MGGRRRSAWDEVTKERRKRAAGGGHGKGAANACAYPICRLVEAKARQLGLDEQKAGNVETGCLAGWEARRPAEAAAVGLSSVLCPRVIGEPTRDAAHSCIHDACWLVRMARPQGTSPSQSRHGDDMAMRAQEASAAEVCVAAVLSGSDCAYLAMTSESSEEGKGLYNVMRV